MNLHGFELVKEQHIKEINTQAKLYRHIRTGAQLLSLENSDENKCFGVNFATPPADSTGLPHILEHSVLGGSRKYPVKEPFMELVKGSLNTFLNAMTFPDMTLYPVASQNLQDFYNLVDVYLDAVFYPRISEMTLQQEGWHYELESADAPLTFKGVVFNEMKGAYSSPDALVGKYTEEALYPDTIYSNDSGGDPAVIPDLTYAQFKRFHETYYHPSNARFYFYGDDSPEERLRRIDEFIAEFERIDVNTNIPSQPRWDGPRRASKGYDAGEEAGANKAMVTLAWLLTETADVEKALALEILEHILIGTPASPLRKALLDSGLGEDLTGAGLSPYQREMYFATGLKGIDPADVEKVEKLIQDTLDELAEKGIDKDTVAASMNTIEFQRRELNTGRFPRGLMLMIGLLPTWMHGGDPMAPLSFEAPLQRIKDRLAAGEKFFEGLIGSYFIDNAHRSTILLEPDATVKEKREAAERERLEEVQASMTDEELQEVIDNTHKLREMQETPNTPEALATIPSLALADLDKQVRTFPLETLNESGARVLYHDLPTNGVAYLDIGFDLHALPADLLPYVQLFGRALVELGTQDEDFVKLSQRIGRQTGGIRSELLTSASRTLERGETWLLLRSKSMAAQTGDLIAILKDILHTVNLDNRERFRQIVLEEKACKEARIVPSGHIVTNLRLRSHFTEADWASEQMSGINYLFFLRRLAEQVENDWSGVLESLKQVWTRLINRNAMLFNVTLDAANWSAFRPQLSGLIDGLPADLVESSAWSPVFSQQGEGLTIPAQVNYVGKGVNLHKLGHQVGGSIRAILQYMNTTYIHDKLRVQGGAYGGFTVFDHHAGNFAFLSYRDPNLLGTLDNYDGAGAFLRTLEISQDELTRSIIGAIGQMDAYLLPDAKGYTSMVNHLIGNTDDVRQQFRDELLGTTAADFHAFAEAADAVAKNGLVVVVGSKDGIIAANEARPGLLDVVNVL